MTEPPDAALMELMRGLSPQEAAVVGALMSDRDRLAQAAIRYERLVESAEDGICALDTAGHFTFVNRSLLRALGRRRDSLLAKPFADFLPGDDRAERWRMFVRVMAGERERGEVRFTGARGAARVASLIASPLTERGRICGVMAILRDVTDERAMLEQTLRREKLAAMGELVGGIAHEVNSPLTSILAFGQLLQTTHAAGDADSRKSVDTIVNEAKRAARIVGKFLTLARQQPSEKMQTDLNQVLLDTIELRRYPLKLQKIVLELSLAEQLPPVWADPFHLQQVFINLLNNAEQALAPQRSARRIIVRTERRGDHLLATVTDSGPGIAPEHLPNIFNPFYTTKARGVGTGLGLSISFGIVRDHDGVLRVRSSPGEGASFEVSLPIIALLPSASQH